MEVTGPEGLRIVVDSDHGVYRRFLALFAECFAIDIAFGAGERPAVLIGQHLRLFLERDYRHDSSPVCNSLLLRFSASALLRPSVSRRRGGEESCVKRPAAKPRKGPPPWNSDTGRNQMIRDS